MIIEVEKIIEKMIHHINECQDDPDECWVDTGIGLTKNEAMTIVTWYQLNNENGTKT